MWDTIGCLSVVMRYYLSISKKWRKALLTVMFFSLVLIILRSVRRPFQNSNVRVIGYYCEKSCGGWADRQKGIVTAFVIAAMLGKRFKIHMPRPCDLGFFLSPRQMVDWRLDGNELNGRSVEFVRKMSDGGAKFGQEFLSRSNPIELFDPRAEIVFLTSNMEIVQVIRQHKMAQGIEWLQELSVPQIYRRVLTQLFTLMPGPRATVEAFHQSLPSHTKLICAQIRMGGSRDTETINTWEQLHGLISFLAPYNSSSKYRLMFTSDSTAVTQHARSYFPSVVVEIKGPVTHVDLSTGRDVCGGFGRTIVEQLILSTCDVLVISESGLAKIAAFIRNRDEDLYIFHDGMVEKFEREDSFPNRKKW